MKTYKYKLAALMLLLVFFAQDLVAQDRKERRQTKTTKAINKAIKEGTVAVSMALEEFGLAIADVQDALKDVRIEVYNDGPVDKDDTAIEPEVSDVFENEAVKVKKLSRSFSVDASDKLSIANSYGKVIVNTWAKKEIKVDIEIKAYESDEENAEKLLQTVSIKEQKEANLIGFQTVINKNNFKSNSWWKMSFGDDGDERKVEIIYNVYMPANNPLALSTNYSNITLPDLNGPVSISMNYNDLNAGKLSNGANAISSNYSKLNLKAFNGKLSCNYGNATIADANNLKASVNYTGLSLGSLSGSSNINMSYSPGFKIARLENDFKNLNVNADYSTIALGFAGNESFNFDVTVNYASFKYDADKTSITSKSPDDEEKAWSSTKNFKGNFGKNPGNAKIVIKADYGAVRFN